MVQKQPTDKPVHKVTHWRSNPQARFPQFSTPKPQRHSALHQPSYPSSSARSTQISCYANLDLGSHVREFWEIQKFQFSLGDTVSEQPRYIYTWDAWSAVAGPARCFPVWLHQFTPPQVQFVSIPVVSHPHDSCSSACFHCSLSTGFWRAISLWFWLHFPDDSWSAPIHLLVGHLQVHSWERHTAWDEALVDMCRASVSIQRICLGWQVSHTASSATLGFIFSRSEWHFLMNNLIWARPQHSDHFHLGYEIFSVGLCTA